MALSRPRSSIFNRKTFTVPAATTLTIDTMALADFISRKYLIDTLAPTSRYSALEMSVSRKGSDVADSVSHRLGDSIDVDFSFEVSGSNALLKASNNEGSPIDVTFLRI